MHPLRPAGASARAARARHGWSDPPAWLGVPAEISERRQFYRAEARSVQAVELRYWVAKRLEPMMQSKTRLSNAWSGASCATCMAAVVNGEGGHDTELADFFRRMAASKARAAPPRLRAAAAAAGNQPPLGGFVGGGRAAGLGMVYLGTVTGPWQTCWRTRATPSMCRPAACPPAHEAAAACGTTLGALEPTGHTTVQAEKAGGDKKSVAHLRKHGLCRPASGRWEGSVYMQSGGFSVTSWF